MSESTAIKYELWRLPKGYTFFDERNEEARRLLDPGAKLAWTFEAASWAQARAMMQEYLATKRANRNKGRRRKLI